MKKILFVLTTLFVFSCKAQIINITEQGNYMKKTSGQYYKDVDNLLNPFIGTWIFTEGNKELKMIFIKKTNHDNGVYSEDLIIGGYEYKVNGISQVNTLNDITNFYLNSIRYSISGNSILENDYTPPCNACLSGEKRLMLSFSETASNLMGTLIIRKIDMGGQEAIKIKLYGSATKYYQSGTTPPPNDFVLPSGEYTLIKQ